MPSATAVTPPGRMPPLARLIRVGLGLVALTLVSAFLNERSYRLGGVSIIWLSNGLLLGALLCSVRRQWPAFLLLGYVIDLSLNLAFGTAVGISINLSFFNMVEVLIAAALMAPAIAAQPDLTSGRQIRSFLLYGVFLAPTAAAVIASAYLYSNRGIPFGQSLHFWFAADVLGIATITPLYLNYHHGERFSKRSTPEIAVFFVGLFAVSEIVFSLGHYPALWMVLLALLLLGVRLGFTAGALGLLVVTFIGGDMTIAGLGPLGPTLVGGVQARILYFQVFILFSMLALYLTEVAMSANRRAQVQIRTSEARFRLLAESSRDIIVLADLSAVRKYVSPAITEILGWDAEETVGNHYTQLLHPDDAPRFGQMLADLRVGEGNATMAYRCRRKDNSYIWVETNVRLLRDVLTGEPEGYVYIIRDITERKLAEDKLNVAYHAAERLAMVDGLTGVANRRLLDETLKREWAKAAANRAPISLLLIDVDHFKLYNDLYGHLVGDACLQQIAKIIPTVLREHSDLLARYGGEEFVVILPNIAGIEAQRISERIRRAVADCRIPHAGNSHNFVTVSLGCATELPTPDLTANVLLLAADDALYRAKANGRNRLHVAGEERLLN